MSNQYPFSVQHQYGQTTQSPQLITSQPIVSQTGTVQNQLTQAQLLAAQYQQSQQYLANHYSSQGQYSQSQYGQQYGQNYTAQYSQASQGQYGAASSFRDYPQFPQGQYGHTGYTQSGINATNSNALWMGDIDPWMDENFIYNMFAHIGDLVNVKIIRDKQTGYSNGYGFIYFSNPQTAQYVLENFNGQPIPGTNRYFRLNYAAYGMGSQKRNEAQAIFVGDLAPDVTDYFLQTTFQYYYPSVYCARVVADTQTGLSKGYGFVYFNDESERQRALTEMQGFPLSYKPIKVNVATKKNQSTSSSASTSQTTSASSFQHSSQQGSQTLGPADPNNTTVFVGGIDPSVTHDVLRAAFSQFGEITGIKIPTGKGCGFVEFATHDAAAKVLAELNGSAIIGNSQVRLSWGRPTLKQTGASSEEATTAEHSEIYQSHLSTQDITESYYQGQSTNYEYSAASQETSKSPEKPESPKLSKEAKPSLGRKLEKSAKSPEPTSAPSTKEELSLEEKPKLETKPESKVEPLIKSETSVKLEPEQEASPLPSKEESDQAPTEEQPESKETFTTGDSAPQTQSQDDTDTIEQPTKKRKTEKEPLTGESTPVS